MPERWRHQAATLFCAGGDSYKGRASGSLHAWHCGCRVSHNATRGGEGLTLLLPVPAPLREDHKVQVNTLHIRWDGIAVPGADRHGLHSWHM